MSMEDKLEGVESELRQAALLLFRSEERAAALSDRVERLQKEVDTLRAKVDEQQEEIGCFEQDADNVRALARSSNGFDEQLNDDTWVSSDYVECLVNYVSKVEAQCGEALEVANDLQARVRALRGQAELHGTPHRGLLPIPLDDAIDLTRMVDTLKQLLDVSEREDGSDDDESEDGSEC